MGKNSAVRRKLAIQVTIQERAREISNLPKSQCNANYSLGPLLSNVSTIPTNEAILLQLWSHLRGEKMRQRGHRWSVSGFSIPTSHQHGPNVVLDLRADVPLGTTT